MQSVTTNTSPLVSVIIASFNMAEFIEEAIISISEGIYRNVEVIVIDDGSTDNTADVVKALLGDQRIKYIYQENAGQTSAKNHGLGVSSGELIAFCDADDYWELNKLELQVPLFDDEDIGIVYSEVSYVDQNGDRYDKSPPYARFSGEVTEHLLLKNFVPFGTSVFRRACFTECGGFDERYKMGIDWDLWLRYSLSWKFLYLSESTYVYREWEGQMSNNHRGRYESAFVILRNFEDSYGDRVKNSILRKAWADNYVSRGLIFARKEKLFAQPVKDVLVGLSLNPLSLSAWKGLIKIIIGRA